MKCFFTFYKHRVGKIATKLPREEWNTGTHYNILVNKRPKVSIEMSLGKEIKEVRYI